MPEGAGDELATGAGEEGEIEMGERRRGESVMGGELGLANGG